MLIESIVEIVVFLYFCLKVPLLKIISAFIGDFLYFFLIVPFVCNE